MDQLVFQNTESAQFINKTFVSFKIIKGDENYKELREQFNMLGFPTIIVLLPDGEERDRIIGFDGNKEAFLEIIFQSFVTRKQKNVNKENRSIYHVRI